MALVTTGLMNKQVAGELGLSEITVKIHRGHAMKKMNARSLADLVRMAESLGLHKPKAHPDKRPYDLTMVIDPASRHLNDCDRLPFKDRLRVESSRGLHRRRR